MASKIREPKDLGVKIGTKEEKAWTDIMTQAKKQLEQAFREIEINKAIVALSQRKIDEEKEKFK